MSLLTDTELVLSDAEYVCSRSAVLAEAIEFEDDTLLGFVSFYESVEELLLNWRPDLDRFLTHHAAMLRDATQKVWNCYSAFLTSAANTTTNDRALLWKVEEDFTSSRKIARPGVRTVSDIRNALLPILPIANLSSLPKLPDRAEIAAGLGSLQPGVRKRLLAGDSARQIAKTLVEEA
jgi:hypothetical protein